MSPLYNFTASNRNYFHFFFQNRKYLPYRTTRHLQARLYTSTLSKILRKRG